MVTKYTIKVSNSLDNVSPIFEHFGDISRELGSWFLFEMHELSFPIKKTKLNQRLQKAWKPG
jgi:hypothetical protein